MSLPDVNDSLAYTGRPVRRSGSAKRTLSHEDLNDVLQDNPKESKGATGGNVKRTKSSEKVRYSYIDPEWEYSPETLEERLSENNAREAGIRDIDEGSKRNSLGRKRKSWLKDHENDEVTESTVEEVTEPDDPDPKTDLDPDPDLEVANSDDEVNENPFKADMASSEDELDDVKEQNDVTYETFLDAYGGDVERMEESLQREKEGIMDELTGGIRPGQPRGRNGPPDGVQPRTDMVPGEYDSTSTLSSDRDFYDPTESKRPKHEGPGISPDAILAAMIMERLGAQKPIRARVGRRVEDEQDMGNNRFVPTLPYRTLKPPPPNLPPDGPPHYSPRMSGRGRGQPYGPYGPYSRPGDRPGPARKPQAQAGVQPRINDGPIIHGARPDGVPAPRPKTPPTPEPEPPELIPDPVAGAVSATLEKKNANKDVPDEYVGYYIETCIGVDGDFYNSPKAARLRTPKKAYEFNEPRVKSGITPELRSKSLERGLDEWKFDDVTTDEEVPQRSSTMERGRERERVNRARRELIKDEGSQGSLDGSKERPKPSLAPKPKISDKLKEQLRTSSQERVQTPTANEKLRAELRAKASKPSSTETGAAVEKRETSSATVQVTTTSSSTVKVGTVERKIVKSHEQSNESAAGIEVVELSDTSSAGSSRPGSRPGSGGAKRPTNLGATDDFMYNAMLQQSIKKPTPQHNVSRSAPRNQTSSMDRSASKDQNVTSKEKRSNQTTSVDRNMARKAFFEPHLVHTQTKERPTDDQKRGGDSRGSAQSSVGSASDKDSPRDVPVNASATPVGPVIAGSAPAPVSGPVLAGTAPQSVKTESGQGDKPERATQGSVEKGNRKKMVGRVATPLVVTRTPESERSEDVTEDRSAPATIIVTKTPKPAGTDEVTSRAEIERSDSYKVAQSETTMSFREAESLDSFRTPERELHHEMEKSSRSNKATSSQRKQRSSSKERRLDESTPKSGSKDRRKKDTKNQKGQISRDKSFDSQDFSTTIQTDRSDTTYGQDSMTDAVVRGAVRDTVHDNMFGQESTLSPVTPSGTQWSVMEERFSTPKERKEKKTKGGFFAFGSKRKPRRSRENSLDSTLDTTMDSSFEKKSMASVGSQDALNETVKRTGKEREREKSKDRTVKLKDKNRKIKEKGVLKGVAVRDGDSIQDMYIEGDDDLLKKEDMGSIGQVPMEMTSTPDRQRKVKTKPKSGRKVEVVDLDRSTDSQEISREKIHPHRDENWNSEYTTTKDVMSAMFAGTVEGKKRTPRKSKERKERKEEEERLHIRELSIDEMLKEREISNSETVRESTRRVKKETSSTKVVKEDGVEKKHRVKEQTVSRPQKDKEERQRPKENKPRHAKETDEREETKENTSRTRKYSDEDRQIVKKNVSRTEKEGRYVKPRSQNKEPSAATRAIMSELLLQVGASPGKKDVKAEREEDDVVLRKAVKKRRSQSEEKRSRRQVQRTENGEMAVQERRSRKQVHDPVQNGDESFEEYKVQWNEYPDEELEDTSFSGFDASLDDVIEERENRKSEVFRMLLEDSTFERKLRRLAEKRARELEKAEASESETTDSTPLSADRSSESIDEAELLRELEKRIEEYFERQKQKKIKVMMKKFMAEEGNRMSRLMSHKDEVLDLIALKDRELYGEIVEPKLPPAPAVEPPEYSRSALYVSADVFEELDTEIIEIAQFEQASYIELVRDLTRRCKDELERVRAIFRWITVKDLSKIKFDEDEKINPDSLLGMLKGIKEGKASYHDLFKRLCGYAGIHCHVIQGYSKGAGYRPGMKVEHKAFRNTWTAVNVNKSWRFVNCNWGARHYKNTTAIQQEGRKGLCYKCDEFYFLTDPDDHIFQHFPDDKKWQLLRHPITINEFMRLPVLKSPFFNAGLLKPQRKLEDRIHSEDGRVELSFKMRKFAGMHCTLELIEDKTVIPEPEGHSLIRIIDDRVIFMVQLPDLGRYFFNIYVSSDWKSNSLEHAASFLIIAGDDCFDNGSNSVIPSTGVIGRTPVMSQLGIAIPRDQDPYIQLSCRQWTEVTLPFTLKRDVKLSHQMKLFNRSGKYIGDYDQFVFLKYKGSKSYCVRCPKEGIYSLSIFAGDAKDRSPKLECVAKYLIDCESAQVSAPPFPKPSRRWIGCTLHEPITGELEVDRKYRFSFEIPDAVEVCVVIGDNWQSLEFSERSEDLWEGTINTGRKAGKTATVFVRYDEESDKFSPLLDYTIIDKRLKPMKA